MKAPDKPAGCVDESARGLEQIITDTVELVDAGGFADASNTIPAGVVIAFDARNAIRTLRELDRLSRPLTGYRTENLKSVERIREQIKVLQASLKQAPDAVLSMLFVAPKLIDYEDAGHIPSHIVREQEQAQATMLLTGLARLRARCGRIIKSQPGKHGLLDHRKELAASEAYDFLQRHNKQPASVKSATSVFPLVSALFYEAMNAEHGPNADMERACKAVFARKSNFPKKIKPLR